MKTEEIHISQIMPGHTILHNNKEMTVSKKDITWDSFMGFGLFGDSYRLGTKLVIRVLKSFKELQRCKNCTL
jgi:hypothetical protein